MVRWMPLLLIASMTMVWVGCEGGPTSAMESEPDGSAPDETELSIVGSDPSAPLDPPVADVRVGPQITKIDGQSSGIQPGSVVCLSGTRPFLILEQVRGRPDAPITITNCAGGTARIQGGLIYEVVLYRSQHVRIVGSSSPESRYGLVIDGAGQAQTGLSIDQRSSDVEVAYVEIKNSSFAGLMAKTNHANAGAPSHQRYVLRNLRLHHLYIHDVAGEGMYLGPSAVGPEHHTLENVHLHNNVIARTGWDGLQISNATDAVRVHNNVIVQSGLEQEKVHANGLQIGGNTVGRYSENLIVGSHAWNVAVFGQGNITISDNLLSGGQGVFVDDRPGTDPRSSIVIRRNTMREIEPPYFRILNEKNQIVVEANRLGSRGDVVSVAGGAGSNVVTSNNTRSSPPPVQFVRPAAGNFCQESPTPYGSMGLATCR